LVQIQLYFNRNVRQFTARTTTVTCIDILLAVEGGSIEPDESPLGFRPSGRGFDSRPGRNEGT